MDVYWLEQTEDCMPEDDDWLSANEVLRMHAMRFAKRRNEWRLGRWTAKTALATYLGHPMQPRVLAKIEIRPAASGAPEAFVVDKPAALTISLSHRDGRAACAAGPFGAQLGCDLESVEPHSDTFVADYFTATEQALVAKAPEYARQQCLAMLWSAKESALKALHTGLRLDTRCVIVNLEPTAIDLNGWSPLHVRCINGPVFRGWWQSAGSFVRTMVAHPEPNSPIFLEVQHFSSGRASRCA